MCSMLKFWRTMTMDSVWVFICCEVRFWTNLGEGVESQVLDLFFSLVCCFCKLQRPPPRILCDSNVNILKVRLWTKDGLLWSIGSELDVQLGPEPNFQKRPFSNVLFGSSLNHNENCVFGEIRLNMAKIGNHKKDTNFSHIWNRGLEKACCCNLTIVKNKRRRKQPNNESRLGFQKEIF